MTQLTNFIPEKCLAYGFSARLGLNAHPKLTGEITHEQAIEEFNQLAEEMAQYLSVWRSVDDELPPDEVECVFETDDGWLFVGDFRENRGLVMHKYGYEMIDDIKRWQPIHLPVEVQS